MLTLSHALEQLATDLGRSFSSSFIKLGAILVDEKYLIILLSSYCWYKLAFILCRQSKFSIYHSQDKHFLLLRIRRTSSLFSSKLQTPPSCEASFIVSQRYLCTKGPCCLKYTLSIPYGSCFSSPFFLLLSSSSPLLSLWYFSSAPS